MGAVTKVVIDTNVFISAFGWDGKPEAVLSLMERRKVVNCITNDAPEFPAGKHLSNGAASLTPRFEGLRVTPQQVDISRNHSPNPRHNNRHLEHESQKR